MTSGSRRCPFLCTLFLVALTQALVPAAAGATPVSRPNIVLILADDMGYECVGANGGTSYRTPVLDRMAREGLRFEHCYSQPICTPSRVQIMTGIYNQRNYIRFGILDHQATTFANLLRRSGYRTCVAGKWQLRGGFDGPGRFGFDEYCLWQLTVRKSRYPNPVLERSGDVIEYRSGEYGPDVVSDYLCDFIERNRDRPFLAYYPMILPHWPFEPTPDSSDWNPRAEGVLKGQGDKRYFADMVAYTDKMVGKLVRKIDALGLAEKTLILFTCDNGTAVGINSRMGNRVVPGGKGQMTDTGNHVPLIARWPGVIASGGVSRDLVDFSDFLPTLMDAAGIATPKGLDGRSFFPQLKGEKGAPREWVYCWYARNGGPTGQETARTQRFKLHGDGRLFDLETDWQEKRALGTTGLAPEAAAARERLQKVLDDFKGTRRIYEQASADLNTARRAAVARVKRLGGHAFLKGGEVVEINLNRSAVSDGDMKLFGALSHLTDLSLEETRIGDEGARHLGSLRRLEWLNLYRTRVGDRTLAALREVRSLKLLPIGETRVTDKGLGHLASMPQLEYLGLRGNTISDDGLRHIESLVNLRGLHLGETKVSDAGLGRLAPLRRLERLWLSETVVSDAGIEALERLPTLRELHLTDTRVSAAAVQRLRAALPRCRVVYGRSF